MLPPPPHPLLTPPPSSTCLEILMNTLMDIEVLLCAATAIITVKDHPMSQEQCVYEHYGRGA